MDGMGYLVTLNMASDYRESPTLEWKKPISFLEKPQAAKPVFTDETRTKKHVFMRHFLSYFTFDLKKKMLFETLMWLLVWDLCASALLKMSNCQGVLFSDSGVDFAC